MFVADTNILIYAADRSAREYKACRELLQQWRRLSSPWFLTWSICYEFLRVATHPRVFRTPWTSEAAWRFLGSILASPAVTILSPTHRHPAVLRQTLAEFPQLSGNRMHDLHTAVLMREHGISRIVTRDRDFQVFPFLTVIDPLE